MAFLTHHPYLADVLSNLEDGEIKKTLLDKDDLLLEEYFGPDEEDVSSFELCFALSLHMVDKRGKSKGAEVGVGWGGRWR
jgi:hypothetical protein